MTLTELKDLFTIVGVFVTAGGIIWAVYVFRRNSNLERVKWIATLYDKFYEEDDLKVVREILDCKITEDKQSKPEKKVASIVEQETKDFTDYLNFFELIAFLEKNNQLTVEQIDDLFGYYLGCIKRHQVVLEYLEPNGYELLDNLLKRPSEKKK